MFNCSAKCHSEDSSTKLIICFMILFLLNIINSQIGNYYTLFILLNGSALLSYLKHSQKSLYDKYSQMLTGSIQSAIDKIPKYKQE